MKIAPRVPGLLSMPPPGRVWVWAVFGLALPALASPVLFVPLDLQMSRQAIDLLVLTICYPRCWASAATLLAVFGARRWGDSRLQLLCVACIVVLAWLLATETAEILRHVL